MKNTDLSSWKNTIPEKLNGDKLYIRRARLAFPILVRQAKARNAISYGDLAKEIGMPNPRNLNFVLGAIGTIVERLNKADPIRKIPALTCIVISQLTHLPGDGIEWFFRKEDFTKLLPNEKRNVVDDLLGQIYSFRDWDWVLTQCELDPIKNNSHSFELGNSIEGGRNGGESEFHKNFKKFIAENPKLFGVSSKASVITEFELPSQDKIDVCFLFKGELIGVEAKSVISDLKDIRRGIFQCVKYEALLEAMQIVEHGVSNCRVILAVEGEFPMKLLPMKNQLGVTVMEIDRKKI